MTETVTASTPSHFWLIGPFHDKILVEGEGRHRLRSVVNLCQSPTITTLILLPADREEFD